MTHWSYTEMKECFGFSLDQYIYYGGYPGAAELTKEPDRWEQYIQSAIIDATINKDIRMQETPSHWLGMSTCSTRAGCSADFKNTLLTRPADVTAYRGKMIIYPDENDA